MSLKKITAFEDTDGKIWRNEADYLKELSRKEEERKRREKGDLVRRLVTMVYPRFARANVGLSYEQDAQYGASLSYLLSRLSLEDLYALEPYFAKMQVAEFNTPIPQGDPKTTFI